MKTGPIPPGGQADGTCSRPLSLTLVVRDGPSSIPSSSSPSGSSVCRAHRWSRERISMRSNTLRVPVCCVSSLELLQREALQRIEEPEFVCYEVQAMAFPCTSPPRTCSHVHGAQLRQDGSRCLAPGTPHLSRIKNMEYV